MSQPVNVNVNRPLGSLHTIVSPVKFPQGEGSAVIYPMILPALQRYHLSVFSECCFLELLARPSSSRTLLLSGLVVLFSIL